MAKKLTEKDMKDWGYEALLAAMVTDRDVAISVIRKRAADCAEQRAENDRRQIGCMPSWTRERLVKEIVDCGHLAYFAKAEIVRRDQEKKAGGES
jgi:hypothetical protein